MVDYVGIELTMDGFAVQANGGDFAAAVRSTREVSHRPLILIGGVDDLKAGLAELAEGESPLLCCANAGNWQEMAALAKENNASLAIEAGTVDEMVDLAEKLQKAGVKDIVLSPTQRSLNGSLMANTVSRRMALKKNFRPLGFPIISYPGDWGDPAREVVAAGQAIGKYSSFIVMDNFSPDTAYPLLVLRENIYTDPQKPIQVTPGLYEINDPGPEDPVLVTTNFSITYFSVANEVEGSGNKAWMLVCDAEGMSVLTAWAAGKFDAEVIAKDAKRFGAARQGQQQAHRPPRPHRRPFRRAGGRTARLEGDGRATRGGGYPVVHEERVELSYCCKPGISKPVDRMRICARSTGF